MAFSPLGDYLSRFKNLTLPNETVRKVTKEVILEISGVDVQIEKLSLRNGTIQVDLVGTPKNEIFLHKPKIIEEIEKRLGKKSVFELR